MDRLSRGSFTQVMTRAAAGSFGTLGITVNPACSGRNAFADRLPRFEHHDPFDRMLIWQCLQRRWTLVSRDRGFDAYRALGLKTAW
jgi:PIN domain nuclease of toxin-antitoxin system